MASEDIQKVFNEISQTLFDVSPLSFFALSITNLEKKQVSFICSHPAFNIGMFDEEFPFLAPFLGEGLYSADGIFKKLPERYANNDLANVFYVIKYVENLIFCYTFESKLNHPPMINFYLNNINFIDRFLLYFQEQSKEIIQELLESHHTIPHHIKPALYKMLLHEQIKEEPFIVEAFYNKTTESWIHLTERERETLLHVVIHGKTASKTGEALNISAKTVEKHIENLRFKLSATSKGELLQRAIDMGLIRLQFFF